jgi:hypothetical protein
MSLDDSGLRPQVIKKLFRSKSEQRWAAIKISIGGIFISVLLYGFYLWAQVATNAREAPYSFISVLSILSLILAVICEMSVLLLGYRLYRAYLLYLLFGLGMLFSSLVLWIAGQKFSQPFAFPLNFLMLVSAVISFILLFRSNYLTARQQLMSGVAAKYNGRFNAEKRYWLLATGLDKSPTDFGKDAHRKTQNRWLWLQALGPAIGFLVVRYFSPDMQNLISATFCLTVAVILSASIAPYFATAVYIRGLEKKLGKTISIYPDTDEG